MARRRGPRHLVVGQERFLWQVRHAHRAEPTDGSPASRDCREIVSIWHTPSKARLDIVLRETGAGFVSAGVLHSAVDDRGDAGALNLHRPGVVRVLLDEAVSRGWRPGRPGRVEMNGWDMFDRCLARLAEAETDPAGHQHVVPLP